MTPRSRPLTIDEAIGEFQAVLKEELGDSPPLAAMARQTPEEAEAGRFRFAEYMQHTLPPLGSRARPAAGR